MKPEIRYVIGIDLGATMLRGGAFACGTGESGLQGELLAVEQCELFAIQGPQAGLERIAALVESLAAKVNPGGKDRKLAGIGVGCTGPVDARRGVIVNPGTLPGWVDVPIVAWLEQRFGVPTCLENDADVAALGEYWMGAGRGTNRLYAITVGTGIGTACIIDGQIYRGAGDFHPEGGHLLVDPAGPPCYCGGRGCWESLASGTAIAASMRAALETQRTGPGPFEAIEARAIVEAARRGDPLAQKVIERAAEAFAQGLFSILMLFFPEVVVLSGGVMRSYDLFQPAIARMLQETSVYIPSGQVRVELAQLGYFAGIYGAAYAVNAATRQP
jgi:glucokinase